MSIEEEIYYSSTSTDGSSTNDSSSESTFLDTFEFDTNISTYIDDINTISLNTIGLNLEILLEMDNEYLYIDVTSIP